MTKRDEHVKKHAELRKLIEDYNNNLDAPEEVLRQKKSDIDKAIKETQEQEDN